MAGPRIIDGHVHIMAWHLARPEIVATMQKTQPEFPNIQSYVKDPKTFIARLDEEGIERAALINYVAPEVMGFTPAVNAWVHDYTKDHRDRLIPFGGIHPGHTKDPKKDVETLLSTYELSGIKLHPVHSLFRVNDYEAGGRALRILYDACERLKVPVMIHTGTSIFPNARNKFGDPMDIDDVAVDHPRMPIVIAHAGRPLWMETAMFLARRHPNIHLDLSGIPPKKILDYLPDLERVADRAIFGSDWPGPMIPSMRQNALDLAAQDLSSEAKDKILYQNARKLYK